MFNHEPEGYDCPFCRLVAGEDDPAGVNLQADIVRRNTLATAFVSPSWWPHNPGNVLVVADAHHENLYDLPSACGHAVHDLVREVAVAMRHTYGCDGISVRQHNEPAGHQTAWHYHVHVFPRYPGDNLYALPSRPGFVPAAERLPYALKLRAHFGGR
ncbi:HIT family protein [Paractinoplanes abujensis]|uniref:Histidine triad (HIT) family protein n=1 Tax=Paractinoplanes abujensis TaxID=882441 RepID=A0A7W7G1P2_9ACTN|nr:HIT domain-containing protein [Actinoplanes abujensis]MBB4690836.1 histidine triad (HIT) family protein [Actinoplanes abujensis]